MAYLASLANLASLYTVMSGVMVLVGLSVGMFRMVILATAKIGLLLIVMMVVTATLYF